MERNVPLWVLLLCALLGALFMVVFGWAVRSTTAGSDRSGVLGEIAVEIASFPTLVKDTVTQLVGYGTGDYKDEVFRVQQELGDLSDFRAVPTAPDIDVQGLLIRAIPSEVARGWRMLIGVFVVEGDIEHAALLLSPDLEIVRTWVLNDVEVDGVEPQPKHRIFPHGAEFLKDGSLIFTFDGGRALQRVDHCGERIWAVAGPHGSFHHAVTLDDDGSLWTFSGSTDVIQLSADTGEIIRDFSMDDIIAANPDIDILELRRLHDDEPTANTRNTEGKWLEESIHLNDVEPLPTALAPRFDGFEAGDLVLSARSLNLVFVIDRETLKVKWWRIGVTQRQHDPDWQPNGEITILNNRMSRDYSEIVAIDPASFRKRVLFDGRKNNFYTRIRGKHQVTQMRHIIVTSSQQGRVFEINPAGDVVLEIVSTKPGSDETLYTISEMKWFPPSAINIGSEPCEN